VGTSPVVMPRWTSGPQTLTVVRHGESVGNRADAAAREAEAEQLDLDQRDADVELSDTGRDQAEALARWLAEAPEEWRPTLAITSPYRRAAETAAHALGRTDVEPVLDERLRERDLGAFDGLTGRGIRARHPEEAARRKKLGKFYYQPPSGESWADVVLRVRSLLDDLRHGYDGERLWLFTHQAVIMAFRYALEDIDEEHLLRIDGETPIPNASLTRFCRTGAHFELDTFADTRAVDEKDAEVTREGAHRGRGDDHA
jgi:broad specificity phosphatase PhoE